MEFSRNRSLLLQEGAVDSTAAVGASGIAAHERLAGSVRNAVARTRQWLLGQQHADGFWVAELEGDTILESETVLLLAFLGRENSDLARRLARYLVDRQLPAGGWAMYPGGAMDVGGSVKAYFALKLTGHDPSADYMQRARQAIMAHGGADAVNSYTRYYLALLGQISYEHCPAVPPEVVLLPKWLPVNIYSVSAWSRTIFVPLSIMSALRPVREIEPRRGIRELFLKSPDQWPPLRCPGLPGGTGLLSWDRFFRTVDRLAKFVQRHRLLPFVRRRAIQAAARWTIERFQRSDGVGAIYPPIVWSIVALRALGYDDESPEVQYCHQQLNDLMIDDPATGATRVQPCKSPIWDTAITLRALAAAGVSSDSPAITRGVEWLLDQQINQPGDWSETVAAEPAGWCFEFHNDFYPDSDDTAMVLMALREQFAECGAPVGRVARRGSPDPPVGRGSPDPAPASLIAEAKAAGLDQARQAVALVDRTAKAIEKGIAWMRAMQNRDGGWGAFDRNNDRQFLCYVPFADHNAMIDPSTPDLTGRVLESLGTLGHRIGEPDVDQAVAYLRRTQEPDGSWFGRWGVNYVYGTWQSLSGLAQVGVPLTDPMIVAGVNWLLAHQQPCGAWGESADSYADPSLRGQGPPTASQTAWAILGLLSAGEAEHPAVKRGIQYLLDRQTAAGTWDEPEFTGTGFPRVFYLRYHYYAIYFPLLAISRWASRGAAVSAVAT